MGMTKSKIGYVNDKVPWYYGWNPGGFGCSGGCEGCWPHSCYGNRDGPRSDRNRVKPGICEIQ